VIEVSEWCATFADLDQEWRSVVGTPRSQVPVGDWDRLFDTLRNEERRLTADGLWVSGHADLLHVGRVADDELTHSNIVAWLLKPTSPHGLGDRLLAALMAHGWPADREVETDGAVVEREVLRRNPITGVVRIADVVVTMGPTTLVIENKVGSKESLWQCEDLYQIWLNPGADVRFLLLTPTGQVPKETKTQAAADAWRTLSYPALAAWLSDTLNQTSNDKLPTSTRSRTRLALARMTVEQYVATIRESYHTSPFRVGVGGGNVSERE
jgi:hypothetical protein